MNVQQAAIFCHCLISESKSSLFFKLYIINLPSDVSLAGITDEERLVLSLLPLKDPKSGRESVWLDNMAEVGTLSLFPVIVTCFVDCGED
jgi:hypothetical protein